MKLGYLALSRKIISIVSAVILAFGLMPLPAFAAEPAETSSGASLSTASRSDEDIETAIRAMISAGDFVEGEAIVCCLATTAGDTSVLGTQEDSLFANSEGLSTVTARQYAEATGEAIPAKPGQEELTAQSADEPVEISLIHNDGMTTEELLRVLLHDQRVLSAEPNYIMEFESDDQDLAAGEVAGGNVETLRAPIDANQTGQSSDGAHETLTAQSPKDASDDFTTYQWFSDGVESTTPQYLDATNPGVKSPNWNDPTKANATGVVVIMDSGVDYTHPDLVNVMYHFSSELQAQLGCGEFGYAPVREDKTDPMDGYGHGTHCAGIVAAEWNDFGVSGIANGAQICAVSVSKSIEDSTFSYTSVIKGYDFIIRAARAGVDIRAVNRSFDCNPTNNANQVMLQAAGEAGIVTCFASGNASADLDVRYSDNATMQSNPYVLRINASKVSDKRAGFSNIGKYTTDLFAPGTDILSTVPSNLEEESMYYPQADNDPLFFETSFEGELWDIDDKMKDTSNSADQTSPETPAYKVSRGTIGVDGDGASIKFNATVASSRDAEIYIDVPVGSLNDADIQDIGVALYGGSSDVVLRGAPMSSISIQLEDGTYADLETYSRFFGSQGGWSYATLHFADSAELDQGFKRVTDSHGRTCVRLWIEPRIELDGKSPGETADIEFYLDQFSFGKRNNSGFLPYQYMNGTSMASPVVAGCAAIVSSGITGTSPDMRAAQTVRTLKGVMHQTAGYHDLCKQNGQVDLSLLASTEKFAPVVESAQVSGGNVTVKGAYFGTEGTMTVDGVDAQVVSWSDASITVQWPKGVASGLIPFTVKSATGETCRAFTLVAPETVLNGTALYERELTPISQRADGTSIMSAPQSLAASDSGALFAAVSDVEDRDYDTVRCIMRSDDKGISWAPVTLPEELKYVSLSIGDGVLYIWGATPANAPTAIEKWHLYSMDVSQNTITPLRECPDESVPSIGSLAYANGNLFYIHGETDYDAPNPSSHICLTHFNDDYSLGDTVTLKHSYIASAFYDSPYVTATGNNIYVCGLVEERPGSAITGNLKGLERVDVDADGSLMCTDLSATVEGIGNDISSDDICMTSSNQGVFLIGDNLEGLLPAGTQSVATDTYLLKPGATAFEAYPNTLSYAPIALPVAIATDDWLYAYGISKFETTPVFGRATKLLAPEPDKTPQIGESVVVGDYTYTVQSSTEVSVKLSPAGKKSLAKATIKASVKLGQKTFNVTSIDAEGFTQAKRLTSVAIGKNVKTIHTGAFSQCTKLASVTGGAAVTGIEARAFAGCSKLARFKATSKSLTAIGAGAFRDCKSLVAFKAPSTVLATIGEAAFRDCPKLKTLKITGTTALTKKGVKDCLIGSSVKTVDVKNGKIAAYKKFFTKKNCGKKVTVK